MNVNNLVGNVDDFIKQHREFLQYIVDHQLNRPEVKLADVIAYAGGSSRVALVTVDAIKGFCSEGPMSSARVGECVGDISRIVHRAGELGINNLMFVCDTHSAGSAEFRTWPVHCVGGTREAELEDQLLVLPEVDNYTYIAKNSVSAFLHTKLEEALTAIPNLNTVIVMGVVTDLCLYNLATNLKLLANTLGKNWQVIVPLSAIETYDLPATEARELKLVPHEADFINAFFCYHMQLAGVAVVRDLV